MKVSIGVLAYNEENTIVSTIKQILLQDIFYLVGTEIELIIIANGCTDNTVRTAEEELLKYKLKNFSYNVVNLKQAGKSNAWNEYVHTYSSRDSEYYVLVDADIEFGSDNVVKRLIETLIETSEANVAIDQIRKDIEQQKKKSLFSYISLKLSASKKSSNYKAIAGSLYCVRGKIIRQVYMPTGLPVEDGFLRAMIVTDNFTHLDDNSKIAIADDVCHYFQAILSPLALYKHEKRLVIGTTINSIIYNHLWAAVKIGSIDAGEIVKDLNDDDKNWVASLVERYRDESGFWLVPSRVSTRYVMNLIKSDRAILKKLFLLPIALGASFIMMLITLDVNLFFRKNNGVGHW